MHSIRRPGCHGKPRHACSNGRGKTNRRSGANGRPQRLYTKPIRGSRNYWNVVPFL